MPATPDPLPHVDISEHGAHRDGDPQTLDRRLFFQLQVFDVPLDCRESSLRSLSGALRTQGCSFVLYKDLANASGLGVLSWNEDPQHFVQTIPEALKSLANIAQSRREFSMIGRTYSSGYEPDLHHTLFGRPVGNVMNPKYGWHLWYPLRRIGAFHRLPDEEQRAILREHSAIGMAYGQRDFVHDIRLAAQGLDANDHDFVIGLVAGELHALSAIVAAMRKTRQTSEFIAHMGPFFVGSVVEQYAPAGSLREA